MINFEKIRACIMGSPISGDDKMKLINVFADVPDDILENAAFLFEKQPSWVEKINDNKKKKDQALATGDHELWEKIMEEEKALIGDLTHDSE